MGYDLNLVFPHEPSTAQFVRIIGITTVYNESDIVGQVIEQLVSQGIELVVLDNGSTDGSTSRLSATWAEAYFPLFEWRLKSLILN